MAGITFDIRGLPETKAMLSWYSDRQLFNRMRRAVRAGGKVFQGELKSVAAQEPTGNIPDTFRKVPAPKVSSSARRGGVPTSITRPKSPLFNIFEPGAGKHEITGGYAGPMGGPAGKRWRGSSFSARGTVNHPGLKARPILPTAFRRGEGEARDAVAAVLFEPSPR